MATDCKQPTEAEKIDALEFVARVLVQIPDPIVVPS